MKRKRKTIIFLNNSVHKKTEQIKSKYYHPWMIILKNTLKLVEQIKLNLKKEIILWSLTKIFKERLKWKDFNFKSNKLS